MPTDETTPADAEPATAIDRTAALLDAAGVDLDLLRHDYGEVWQIWYSRATGCYHGRRAGNFHARQADPRRYAVAAATPGRLALLLAAQAVADAEQEDSET